MRLSPSSPPTASNVKPKLSWIPGPKSAARDDEQRETAGAVGHLRGDEPDGSDREEVGDLQLQRARVLAPVSIDVEKPAAGHYSGVNRQAHSLGRFEGQAGIDRTEIAAVSRKGQRDAQTNIFDYGL